jgi:RimJ/RimL family protein N-acetyltransferase
MMNVSIGAHYPNRDEPLGRSVDWTPAATVVPVELSGAHVQLRPLLADDADDLFAVGQDPAIWTYLPYGPYTSADELRASLAEIADSTDPLFLTICVDGIPQGLASYLRIDEEHGSIEIGHIWFGSPLQRTTAATEAIFLLARHAFDDLGYRRFEWKCNALNARSRRAAERFGFTFEGVFRNHMVVKGRNRDTAWYAITVEDWPPIRAAYERWLAPENFDASGAQRERLQAATSSTSSATD